MKKIGLFLTGWCRMLLCVGLAALPSASLGARGELLADQRLNLNLSFGSASLREVVSAFTEQTGVVFSYETSLGKRTLSDVHVVIQDAPLEEMLNTLFYDTGISWKIKDHVVALTAIPSSKKNVSTGSAPSPSANRKPVVTGRVVNEEGEPLVGVNVLVKGTTQGTSTDIDGSYSIAVADDDVLQFTYLGYGSAEWRVGTQTRIDVVLKEDKQMLDEVVVVGYGTVKRRDLVGAVDQVDSKVFSERSNPSISRSLQGAIPNLNISMRDGKPSRAATINIRGTGSIGSGGGALVLIDGVEGDLETVNPQDIASVSVLKDASSAAIYGARGAFGVILVTTKSAEEGETKVTYNGSFSLHARTVKPQLVTDGYEWTTGYINAWNGYYNGQNPLPSYINNIAPPIPIAGTRNWHAAAPIRRSNACASTTRISTNTSPTPTGWTLSTRISTTRTSTISAYRAAIRMRTIMYRAVSTIRTAFTAWATNVTNSTTSAPKATSASVPGCG